MFRPRIGVDFHTFDGIYQGSRSHILGLFSEAIKLAPKYTFVFFLQDVDRLKSEFKAFRSNNVELVRMPSISGVGRLAFQLPYFRFRHGIDLLHMQYRLPFVQLGPCAVTIHDILFETHPQFFGRFFALQSRLAFRFAARAAKRLYTVSEYSKQQIVEKYGIASDQVYVVHNAYDAARFRPDGDDASVLARYGLKKEGYFITVGRLEPRKNHANLLKAMALLPDRSVPLVVVGQRDFGVDNLDELIHALNIESRVTFLEKIDDATLPALIRQARLFVYPAFAEGFGMPVLEAMACGAAVITSSTTSLPEVGGDAAVYVNPYEPRSIADAIQALHGDESLLQQARANSVKRAREFSWGKSASILLDGYQGYFQVPCR